MDNRDLRSNHSIDITSISDLAVSCCDTLETLILSSCVLIDDRYTITILTLLQMRRYFLKVLLET
jgi:hypothetical protein